MPEEPAPDHGLRRPQEKPSRPAWLPFFGLLVLAAGLALIFNFLGHEPNLKTRVPEFIAASLAAGVLYLVGVYWVECFVLGRAALVFIVASAAVFRWLVLAAPPSLSDDVYRYLWEGRVQRVKLNPYVIVPAMPGLEKLQDPEHPLETARTTPTLYPPLAEQTLSLIKTVRGYKRVFTALDLASLLLLIALLAARKESMHRVLVYAWNPTPIVAFAMCGHYDSLAVTTLLLADLLIIGNLPVLSIISLALSMLSKYFSALLLPVFLKRTRWLYGAIFSAIVLLAYLPYASAGLHVFKGLSDYAAGWESNDSLFRLIRAAGNSKPQAELIVGAIMLGVLAYALKQRMDVLQASLVLIAATLFLSPTAFPWYFTWLIPFLCFFPKAPLLLMSVMAIFGYTPVIAYTAGLAYRDSRFILALEYVPVYAWLGYWAWTALRRPGNVRS